MKIMDPIQILLIFMQNMKLLLDKTPVEDVKSDVMPMLYRALECDVSQIQDLCLSILPEFAGLIDRQSLKTALLPRIKKVCISTRLLSVRVNSLICLGKLLEHLDKWQVIDDILPMLTKVPSKEPAVIMGIVGIYKISLTSSKLGLSKEVLANKVLPFLVPLSIENGLTVPQYEAICDLIKDMISRIETEHRAKLHQLNALQDDHTKSFNVSLPAAGQLVSSPSPSQTSQMDGMFSGFGLGQEKSVEAKKMSETSKHVPSHTLSLQDKQRILQEQECLQNKSKNVLTSKAHGGVSSKASSNTPVGVCPKGDTRDLTDTLVRKSTSLNQFSGMNATNTPASKVTGMQQWGGLSSTTFSTSNPNMMMGSNPNMRVGCNQAIRGSNPTMMGSMSSTSMITPTQSMTSLANPSSMSGMMSSVGPMSMTNHSSMMGGRPMYNPAQNNFNVINQTGISSLGGGLRPGQPMQSQPMGLLQPTSTSPALHSSNQSKPLSQSDINDFLG